MLLKCKYNNGGKNMGKQKDLVFRNDSAMILFNSTKISERLNCQYISEEILFVALAITDKSYFKEYLIRRKLTEKEIIEKANFLITNHKDDIEEAKECYSIPMQYRKKTGEQGIICCYIPCDFWDALKEQCNFRMKKEKNDVQNIEISTEDILKVFATKFSNIYEEYMDMCFPEKQVHTVDLLPIPKELQTCLTVLNNKYSPDETKCPILGRDKETKKLISVLAKAKKRNTVLVGEPGVGKTALVEKLAWSIVTGNCHEKFKNCKIVSLDVTSIIAGTKYRGTAEERFQKLISFLEENQNCILFIDEIHTILGAGACSDGELDLANSLKPSYWSYNSRRV